MAEKNDPTPITTSSAYDCMKPYWDMIDAILGGAPAIKAAGETYLPRFQNEQPTRDAKNETFDPYLVRKANSPFTPIYEDISRNLASKPFAKEMTLRDGTPDQFEKLAENIDGQGNNLHVFGSKVFRNGLDKAVDWILVDYTKAKARADGRPLSRAEESEQGLRPYWVRVPAERMLAVYSDFVNGQEIFVHARIYEPITRQEGFGEVSVRRVRVLNRVRIADPVTGVTTGYGPATWEVWEASIGADKSETWGKVDEGAITIGVIALVPFVTGERKGASWEITPPLKGVAYLQITEYQQEANLQNLIDLTCVPMLTGNGVTAPENGIVPVGPRTVLFAPMGGDGKFGSWEFIEPGAESIQKVMDNLDKTRVNMRDLGMQPLTQANLTVITTGQVAVKANSAVQAWTIRFKDAIEQAWKFTAMWLRSTDEPEVEVYMDFGIDMNGTETAKVIGDAERRGVISKKTEREELRRRNILSANNDEDEEEKRLAEEQQGLEPEQPIDPVTGEPVIAEPPPAVE